MHQEPSAAPPERLRRGNNYLLPAIKSAGMKAQTHFDLAQLVANLVDLSVDAIPIQRAALQLVVQTLAVPQEARVFPAALPAGAIAQSGIDPRKENVQLVKFGTKLA